MAADLGYPLGHRVIENILIHCVINAEGLIDFTGVERELARERRLLNTNVTKKDHVRPVTSFSTAAHPWRADVVHNQKMQSERQVGTVSPRTAMIYFDNIENTLCTIRQSCCKNFNETFRMSFRDL